jgi:phytanoyl-CoA dioxygenase PhyH
VPHRRPISPAAVRGSLTLLLREDLIVSVQLLERRPAIADYRRHGYAVLRRVLTASDLDRAERILDRRERAWEQELQQMPDGRSWISHVGEITFTARLASSEPSLRALLTTSALMGFMHEIVGPRPRLSFDQAVYKKPKCTQVVPWHQDNGYNPKVPADYVTFWIPLADTNVDNGTIRFQPRRHHEGPLPHWRTSDGYLACEDGADGGVPIELGRGDVVAFSSLLPHATGSNSTSEIRKAYIASCILDGTCLADGTPCNDSIEQPLLLPPSPDRSPLPHLISGNQPGA